jgi:hypothetical protein
VWAAAIPAAAQDKENMFNPVTTSVTSMSIAPDARGGGMGDVGCATEADVNSQYWNPAKYPFCVSRAGVAISYTPWLRKLVSDINLANLMGYTALATTAPSAPRCAISRLAKCRFGTMMPALPLKA